MHWHFCLRAVLACFALRSQPCKHCVFDLLVACGRTAATLLALHDLAMFCRLKRRAASSKVPADLPRGWLPTALSQTKELKLMKLRR